MAPVRFSLLIVLLSACGRSPDSEMWQCQLAAQKINAGRSADAVAERARDIESCMDAAGFVREAAIRNCAPGSVDASCYRRR